MTSSRNYFPTILPTTNVRENEWKKKCYTIVPPFVSTRASKMILLYHLNDVTIIEKITQFSSV